MATSRAIGTRYETLVVGHAKEHGFPQAERRSGNGRFDRGDVNLGVPVVLECKAAKSWDLSGWMGETAVETETAGADFGFLVVKRPRRGVGDSYVVMELHQLWQLLRKLYG